ncbi:FHA domain-containing protein [Halomonas denitrificans]|nr:FHA domain-containing protein [Halomonas denitrificans]
MSARDSDPDQASDDRSERNSGAGPATDGAPRDRFSLEHQATRRKTPVSGTITVGRGGERELVLDCVKCSRLHAEFRVEADSLVVEDRGSTNGTYVNSRKITEATTLEDGDVVQFGDDRFRVIDVEQQSTEPDADRTVVASSGDLDALLGSETPADAPHGDWPDAPEGAAPDERERGEAGQEDFGKGPAPAAARPTGREGMRSSQGALDASIPGSWADADQLEQASHTSMLVHEEMLAPEHASPSLDPEIAIARAREHAGPDRPILVGLNESVMGVMFELAGGKDETGRDRTKWEIGRSERAEIVIDADSVSGRHCQLVHDKGRWKVVNMMSANGTFVNDRKVLSAYLQPGDVIRMGSVELVFDARVRGARRRKRPGAAPADGRSGVGRLLTAPFRWLGRLFSRGSG